MAKANNEQKAEVKWVPSESCQKYMKDALITTFKSDVTVAYSKFGISFYINIYELVARRMRQKFASKKFITSVTVDKVNKKDSNDYYYAILIETTLYRTIDGVKILGQILAKAISEEFPNVRNIKVDSNPQMDSHLIYFDKPSDILHRNNAEKMIKVNIAEKDLPSFLEVSNIGSSIRVFLKPENFAAIEPQIVNFGLNKKSKTTEDVEHGMKTLKLEETKHEKCKSCEIGIKLGQQTISLNSKKPKVTQVIEHCTIKQIFMH